MIFSNQNIALFNYVHVSGVWTVSVHHRLSVKSLVFIHRPIESLSYIDRYLTDDVFSRAAKKKKINLNDGSGFDCIKTK